MRSIVVNRAKALGLNPYKVGKLVTGKMTPQAVYDYMSGRTDLSASRVFHILSALGMSIVVTDPAPDSVPVAVDAPRTPAKRR